MSETDKDKPKALGKKYQMWTIEDGEASVEVFGCTDNSCQQATSAIERELGSTAKRAPKQGIKAAKQKTK